MRGDAAFLFAETDGKSSSAARSVVDQVSTFFDAFHRKTRELTRTAAACTCDACEHLVDLRLKAILHIGKVAFKTFRNFHELAGEEVILLHRLAKNTIPSKEYIILTKQIHDLVGTIEGYKAQSWRESYPVLGQVELCVLFPNVVRDEPQLPQLSPGQKRVTNLLRHVKLSPKLLISLFFEPVHKIPELK